MIKFLQVKTIKTNRTILYAGRISIILLLTLLITSCYDDIADNLIGNQPPDTGVFLYPDSTIADQPSRLNVSWWGDDPDGLIVGFYFTWDGVNWSFTQSTDSLFALQIGETDTLYAFKVSAVDNGGNGVYDKQIVQNNINYGAEPFTDKNGNGVYDEGENFIDIGLIDPTPAVINFPITNTAPEISWTKDLSFVPDTSFAVMSFGWEASDIDGDATITAINVALNDTTNPDNVVSLDGEVRRITIRPTSGSENVLDILIDGSSSNIASSKLHGIKLNANNRIFVQAVDISGAKSPFISMPGNDSNWFVKKSEGKILIVDDYGTSDNAPTFYADIMNQIGLSGKYDVYDIKSSDIPYMNVTFLETIKLYKYIFWYSDNNPSLDLAATVADKYTSAGGKIFYSLQFPQSTDLTVVQAFLPISADSSDYKTSLLSGVKVGPVAGQLAYPELQTTISLFRARSFYLTALGSIPIYYFPNGEMKGNIGFFDSEKKVFFIGLPLHRLNGGSANVKELFNRVLKEDFGLNP